MQYTIVADQHEGYAYVGKAPAARKVLHRREAAELSRRILLPRLTDPDYLVHRARREILSGWCDQLPASELLVLDVGGRLQPYRALLAARAVRYFAVDPVFEGMLDVAALGERLPFLDASFDLVICTQVLNYASSPPQVLAEIHRVLKPGATLFLTVPAIFPQMHDQRWRFMPDGLQVLLADFADIEIVSEGGSIAGFCRTINSFLETFVRSELVHRLLRVAIFPAVNLAGLSLDPLSRGRVSFTTNYSCRARKHH